MTVAAVAYKEEEEEDVVAYFSVVAIAHTDIGSASASLIRSPAGTQHQG